jgi:hypothetical protein
MRRASIARSDLDRYWRYTRGVIDDTRPEARAVLLEGYRKMTAAEKLRRVAELNRAVKAFAIAGIRERHGPMSDREAEIRFAELTLGVDVVRRALGRSSPAR